MKLRVYDALITEHVRYNVQMRFRSTCEIINFLKWTFYIQTEDSVVNNLYSKSNC